MPVPIEIDLSVNMPSELARPVERFVRSKPERPIEIPPYPVHVVGSGSWADTGHWQDGEQWEDVEP